LIDSNRLEGKEITNLIWQEQCGACKYQHTLFFTILRISFKQVQG